MTYPYTDKPSQVVQYMVDYLRDNWENINLNSPDDVYYGDQFRYPRWPSIAVQTANMRRSLNAVGSHTNNDFQLYILIFHGPLQNEQITERESMEYAETVMDLLHADRSLGGQMVHSYITVAEPGVAERGGAAVRTTRLTWEGLTKTRLGG